MKLSEVFPKAKIVDFFHEKEIEFEEYTISDFQKIKRLKPNSVFEVSGFIWDQFVAQNGKVNPRKYMDFFKNQDPGLIDLLKKDLNASTVKDAYYVKGRILDKSISYNKVAELFLLRIYPDFLHLSDIEFTNPYKPLTPQSKRLPFQSYEGLGLLKSLLANAEKFAIESEIFGLSLTAATTEHFNLFKKHGFSLAETPAAPIALKIGQGIPMTKKLRTI